MRVILKLKDDCRLAQIIEADALSADLLKSPMPDVCPQVRKIAI